MSHLCWQHAHQRRGLNASVGAHFVHSAGVTTLEASFRVTKVQSYAVVCSEDRADMQKEIWRNGEDRALKKEKARGMKS